MRIRTLKPEFHHSETLATLPRETRLLAAGLLNWSDDEGLFRAHPALIAGALFPYDSDGKDFVQRGLGDLEKIGYVKILGNGVGTIPKFSKNQVINRPAKSRLKEKLGEIEEDPTFVGPIPSISVSPPNSSVSTHGVFLQTPEPSVSPPNSSYTEKEEEEEVEKEEELGKGEGSGTRPTSPPLPRIQEGRPDIDEWIWIQESRQQAGLMQEKWVERPWKDCFRVAMEELNGKSDRFRKAYMKFTDKPYWKNMDPPWPIQAFIKNWRDYVS